MTHADSQFHTALGAFYTESVPMGDLAAGDRIVDPVTNAVCEVTAPCSGNTQRFLFVRDLRITDEEVARWKPSALDAGTDPRDAFYSYPTTHIMHRVITGNVIF
jgi:hypothetical protein